MSEARRGVLLLLLVVVLGAATAGALAVFLGDTGPALRVGSHSPDFSLSRLDGRPVSLEQLRGRVVFVNFWATWCPPCRAEAPSMQRLYDVLRDQPFEMLAISVDAPDASSAIQGFRDEFALRFPILLDPAKVAYERYGVAGVPESFLIDAEGRLAERFVGPKQWDEPRYERAIRRLIAAARERVDGAASG